MFTILSWGFGLLILAFVVLCILFVLNRSTGAAVVGVLGGSTGMLGDLLRRMFPAQILQYELNKRCCRFKKRWGDIKRLGASNIGLQNAVDDKIKESARLNALADEALQPGQENEALAHNLLTQKARIDAELAVDRANLVRDVAEFETAVEETNRCQAEMDQIRAEAERDSIRLATAKSNAIIRERLNVTQANDDTLNKARQGMKAALNQAVADNTVEKRKSGDADAIRDLERRVINKSVSDEIAARKERLKSGNVTHI